MSVPNGTAVAENERETLIGISFGNTFSSIAVITKEGKAECIANEEGERQIASCIAFHGEEIYIGNQATHHLIKNSQNTITNFRNLIGKKFSEISSESQNSLTPSAPITQHPTLSDTPCYAVQVLVPSPSPLLSLPTTPIPPSSKPSSKPATAAQTPLDTPTPRSEPTQQTRYITPSEACTIFLRSLHQSATDFLGRTPRGVVISVPKSFDEIQRSALLSAAHEAGLNVLQLLEETIAATAVLLDPQTAQASRSDVDKTTLLVDWGSSDLTVTLLSIRSGLASIVSSRTAPELGSARSGGIDEIFIKYFAKEFSKKTSESFPVCPPTSTSARGQTKLALALPGLKRSLTAAILGSGTGAGASDTTKSAQLSVESLHAGLDFSAPLNRIRAGSLLGPIWNRFTAVVKDVLSDVSDANAGLWVDTLAFVGGTGALASAAGASSTLLASGLFGTRQTDDEEVRNEDFAGSPEEVLARGCAIHAHGVLSLDDQLKEVVLQQQQSSVIGEGVPKELSNVKITSHGIGAVIPTANENKQENGNADSETLSDLGGHFISIIPPNTPLPTKRIVRFQLQLPSSSSSSPDANANDAAAPTSSTLSLPLEFYTYSPGARVQIIPPIVYSDAEEDEAEAEAAEPEEPEEERYRDIAKKAYLGHLQLELSQTTTTAAASSSSGGTSAKKSKAGKKKSESAFNVKTIEIRLQIFEDEKVEIEARETAVAEEESGSEGGGWVKLSLNATSA